MTGDRNTVQQEDTQEMQENTDGEHGRDMVYYETTTADQVKELTRRLQGFTDDELRRIPVVTEGSRLQNGAAYLDLAQEGERVEFTVAGFTLVGPGHWYVPKRETDYVLWNRLAGIKDPERTAGPGTAGI